MNEIINHIQLDPSSSDIGHSPRSVLNRERGLASWTLHKHRTQYLFLDRVSWEEGNNEASVWVFPYYAIKK